MFRLGFTRFQLGSDRAVRDKGIAAEFLEFIGPEPDELSVSQAAGASLRLSHNLNNLAQILGAERTVGSRHPLTQMRRKVTYSGESEDLAGRSIGGDEQGTYEALEASGTRDEAADPAVMSLAGLPLHSFSSQFVSSTV